MKDEKKYCGKNGHHEHHGEHGIHGHHGYHGEHGKHHGHHAHKIEAVINIDEKGQLVLPKAVRTGMGITSSDQLTVSTITAHGTKCVILMRAEIVSNKLNDMFGPLVSLQKDTEKEKVEKEIEEKA